jgi:D-alanyl-D-alanine carboxypeptidase (penicillin-binding protein 5/6)
LPDYSTFANNYAQQLGLSSTHIGSDASGLSPDTTSTPTDMVKLGEIAMNNPVIAQIVGLKTASGLPVVSSVKNVNQLLGVDNIIGIKTGNSDQAGGVFVSASTTSVGGRQVTVVTALANAPTLYDAMYDSLPLIKSAQANFLDVPAVIQDNVVGSYILPWGGSVAILAKNNLSTETWQGTDLKINVNLNKVSTKAIANQQVGTITVQQTPFSTSQTSPAILQKAIPKPPIWWRILHPKGFLSSDSGLAGFKL